MAAARQGLPVRLDRAPQRGAAFALTRASRRDRTRSIGSRSRARGLTLIFEHPPLSLRCEFLPEWNSIATFWPSIKPASFRPWRNLSARSSDQSGDLLSRNPITGIAGGCARAASGHAAAAPSSDMNERRFIIRSPRLRARAGYLAR